MPELFPPCSDKIVQEDSARSNDDERGDGRPESLRQVLAQATQTGRRLEINPFERTVVSAVYVPEIDICLPIADADGDSEREKRNNSEWPPCIARSFDLSASFHCRIA